MDYVIRIPKEQAVEFMKELKIVGEIIYASERATDYCLSYRDKESRIKGVQAEEDGLLKLF